MSLSARSVFFLGTWLVGAFFVSSVSAKQPDLEVIKQKALQTARQHQVQATAEAEVINKSDDVFSVQEDTEDHERKIPEIEVLYSWFEGRVQVRRVNGELLLSLYLHSSK